MIDAVANTTSGHLCGAKSAAARWIGPDGSRYYATGFQYANPIRTGWDAHTERRNVCRDFAHLAVTLCRCMNVPARAAARAVWATSGISPDDAPMGLPLV
jgi:transglutaminase-like putative cysteine protease